MSSEQSHQAHRDSFRATFGLAGEYAKWLLSTLLLLNSGAIAGIFQKDMARDNGVALSLFALGVLFALVSGIFGWFNLQKAAMYYHVSASEILAGRGEPPIPPSINAIRQAAITAAFVSISCLALGAIIVLLALQ